MSITEIEVSDKFWSRGVTRLLKLERFRAFGAETAEVPAPPELA
jgi:hypothetical protein